MILVTGATGHLGNVLIRELIGKGKQIRALVLPGENYDSLDGLDLELIVGNVLDREAVEQGMAGVDLVYHLAGVIAIAPGSEEIMQKVNVEGTRNVAGAALKAKVRRMIHISSIHAFMRKPHGVTIDEEIPLDPDNPAGGYDRTKARGALAVKEVIEAGLDAVIICPTGIIGPHDYLGSEMGQVVKNFSTKKLHLMIDGAFDFVDVRDVARGLIAAAERGKSGETYILSGHHVTLRDLRKLIQKIAGIRSPQAVVPIKLAMFCARFTQHLYKLTKTTPQYTSYSLQTVCENSICSSAKANSDLGYSCRSLEITIRDTLAWNNDYYQKCYQKRGARRSRLKVKKAENPG